MAESHLEFTKPSHVVGRYALYGRLAAGGMATVHLGRVLEADGSSRTVAVKRLHPQFCKDPEFVAMFIDEARLAARIKHPNVVETLDILTMGQELLLVMEYIRGECFSKLLRAARRKNMEPSIGVVGRIASGMLHGLHAAHEARDERGELLNVVHRDISPQNVMIDVEGGVKVLDFGVAKASARIQITRDGQMKGKLSYMSPEQLQGFPVDRRADVFACGVVLWEALTRRRLFVGEDASEVLRKILRDEVPPPSQWMPGLSLDVDRVVLRALSKDPEQRYQTAEELALDVEGIIELASPEETGQWLDSVAGEILGKRERLLQEIERLGLSDVSFDASGAGHGSITDSDTFQRIQSWAEREAARATQDGHGSFQAEDDPEAERTKTVADARCVEDSLASDTSSSVLESDVAGRPDAQPAASAVARAAEHAYPRPPPLPIEAIPFGTGSGLSAAVPPRRERRFMYILSAAAIVLGLGAGALLSLQPSTRVSTSALLPDARHADTSSASAADGTNAGNALTQAVADGHGSAADGAAPGVTAGHLAVNGLAANDGEAVANGAGSRGTTKVGVPGGSGSHDARGVADSAHPLVDPIVAVSSSRSPSSPSAAPPASEESRLRVSEALTQPVKGQQQPPPALRKGPKRPAAVARRAKPAPASAAVAKSGSAKVDCRQPFWIDEGGIRRLKMACL